MKTGIYKEVQIDTSHRLLHYHGKCANLHGHRWKIEVWMEGEPAPDTQIVIDYSLIKKVVEKYDHQIILNKEDPMVPRIAEFHPVITTPGDPTSELIAVLIRDDIHRTCHDMGLKAMVTKIRVWVSPTSCAEITE
ncbi:MAG TPA: 6-carboxytetrahydropterin synthase [Methanoregula sp.]|nr:6-carboxytetrahydropterin synthase [Methanoregula sp.]